MPLNKTVCLHVGFDKTGTSALQRFFSDNAGPLQKCGIFYPGTGRSGLFQHHWLFAPVCDDAEKVGFPPQRSWDELRQALMEEVSAREEPVVLLSSEMLSQGVRLNELAALRDCFAETRIIVYLRRQDQYVMSAYEQSIKTLGCFEAFDLARITLSMTSAAWMGSPVHSKITSQLSANSSTELVSASLAGKSVQLSIARRVSTRETA